MTGGYEGGQYPPPGGQYPPLGSGSPYGGQPHGQPPYGGYPPGGYPAPGPTANSGRATTVLILGIASLVILFTCAIGFIPAIIALCLAPGANREIAQSQGMLGGQGMVTAGKICSWITLGLTVLSVLVLVVFFLAVASV